MQPSATVLNSSHRPDSLVPNPKLPPPRRAGRLPFTVDLETVFKRQVSNLKFHTPIATKAKARGKAATKRFTTLGHTGKRNVS